MPPYPAHLVERLKLKDGVEVTLRPIRPEDTGIEQAFVRNLSTSRALPLMDSVRELSPRMLAHFTQWTTTAICLIATTGTDGEETQIGVARYVADDDRGVASRDRDRDAGSTKASARG